MRDPALVQRLRRRRDRARTAAVIGVMVLMVLGVGFRFLLDLLAALVGNAGPLGGWVALLFILYTATTLALWMYWGWRLHRLDDPWAYDPDLDGPDPKVRHGLDETGMTKQEPPR